MRIEYVFDTVCPWCYVGKRRLQRALDQRPGVRATVSWRPFLLNPDLPPEGIDRASYLTRKFGGAGRVQRIHSAAAAAGRAEGIEFDFESIQRTPNTLNSHRLIRLAATMGREFEVVETLYHAYFCEGIDIGEIDQLLVLGERCGLPGDVSAAYLRSDADVATVMTENARAHRMGVNGVPCVIIDDQYALAGAQEPDILLKLVDLAREAAAEAAIS